jgi:hypothetical protein
MTVMMKENESNTTQDRISIQNRQTRYCSEETKEHSNQKAVAQQTLATYTQTVTPDRSTIAN